VWHAPNKTNCNLFQTKRSHVEVIFDREGRDELTFRRVYDNRPS
jgi:hypothetical protein